MAKESLENLIKELKQNGINAIENLLSNKEVEQYFVDFKTTQWEDYTGKKTLAPDDRKNIEKAISGFGNSEGGLLIWGINTESEGDFASSLKPIISPETFLSLINKGVNRFTIPQHTSVEGFIIRGNGDKGFVVMIVPKFEGLPIQVLNDAKFYMRAGDSFIPILHSILTGMFGRRPNPDVILQFTVNPESLDKEGYINFSVGLLLRNRGKGIARDVFINGYVFSQGGDSNQVGWRLNDKNFSGYKIFNGFNFISKADLRLAPEQNCQPVIYEFKFKPPFNKDLYIEFTVGAEGQAPNKLQMKTKKEEITQAYNLFVKDNKSKFAEKILAATEKKG